MIFHTQFLSLSIVFQRLIMWPWTTTSSLLLIKQHLTCSPHGTFCLFSHPLMDNQAIPTSVIFHCCDIPLQQICGCICFQFSWINISEWNWQTRWQSLMFNFMKCCQSSFHIDYTVFHPHQQCMRVPESSQSCQHLLFSIFQEAILVGVEWDLILFSIFLFLMSNDFWGVFS